ncbi:MAG: hypothetical protein FWH33_06805 [Oscillospiraceae bacterium]|nr:hypothetical protein [Oscillospiraceae bacterium]
MDAQLLAELKAEQYITIMNSPKYKQLLAEICQSINSFAKDAPNEATIESYFDSTLFEFFRSVFEPLGYAYNPIKEQAIATHEIHGRADTVAGALVIEYKHPSTLSTANKQNEAVMQITGYLKGLENEGDSPLVGLVTDGLRCCFVVKESETISVKPFQSLTGEVLGTIIQYIISLSQKALNSKNLVDSFCKPPENNGSAFGLFNNLYSALRNMTGKTAMLFTEWKELFHLAHDDDPSKQQAIQERKAALGALVGERFADNDNEYKALFALQTAYAIILKVVAHHIISQVRYNSSFMGIGVLKQQTPDALRIYLAELEDGAIFRKYGIENLLEGDFFSWYCDPEQWTPEIACTIKEIIETLSLFADKPVLNKTGRSQDFFKALYEAMMPSAVRRSLGEYYTKKWLASKVVDDALEHTSNMHWRGIDPCCGSGTFVTVMIDRIIDQLKDADCGTVLTEILHRVKGIDLNPVAVLTARVNYFINISHLLQDNRSIEIPIYLGDSSYFPKRVVYDGVSCLEYTINTVQYPIDILMPESAVKDSLRFSQVMTQIEFDIKNKDAQSAYDKLISLIDASGPTDLVKGKLNDLVTRLVDLEDSHWNGIWVRIIANFLITASLGKFDIIVGNPPWVDWKNLPSGYRERLKSLCISRKLFSGDKQAGGINLNICALITNVAAENWLGENGVLAFLMPESLAFQQSYEGFRQLFLADDKRLYFYKITNWTKSGHPFDPVTQKFFTYFISRKPQDYNSGIQMKWYFAKRGKLIKDAEDLSFEDCFFEEESLLATCHRTKTFFSHVKSQEQAKQFRAIAGESTYIGREGVEFYPQELLIFTLSGLPNTTDCTALKNIQTKKPKHPVPQRNVLIETEFLYPLVKGIDIHPFHVDLTERIVPFPYVSDRPKLPIGMRELAKRAPQLAKYYQDNRSVIEAQTDYNEKRFISKGSEFYAMARVGGYSYADVYVAFRDNTKWGAAVVSNVDTSWGGVKRPLFQNHAVSICEDIHGNFITFDEAHYVCGILNTPIAAQYTVQSADSRTFPIRPRISIPKYDHNDATHAQIAALSKKAHNSYDDKNTIASILIELDRLYLNLVGYEV